jgi:DUF2075 family protein
VPVKIFPDFAWRKDEHGSPIGALNGGVSIAFDETQLNVLSILQKAYVAAAQDDGHAYAVMEGEAGTGKTLLLLAFLEWLDSKYPESTHRVVLSGERGKARQRSLCDSDVTKPLIKGSRCGPWGTPRFPKTRPVGVIVVDETHSLPVFLTRDGQAWSLSEADRRQRFIDQLAAGGPVKAGQKISPLVAHLEAKPRLLVFVWDEQQHVELHAMRRADLDLALQHLNQQGWKRVDLPRLETNRRASRYWGVFVSELLSEDVICPRELYRRTDHGVYELLGDFARESGEAGVHGKVWFRGRLVASPYELEQALRSQETGSFRLLATRAWDYNRQTTTEQIEVGQWKMYWNSGEPDLTAWSVTSRYSPRPEGDSQAWGAGYATLVQGFEFETVGVIIGDDVILEAVPCTCDDADSHAGVRWKAQRRSRSGEPIDLAQLLHELGVLLTRATRRCYIVSTHPPTLEWLGTILKPEVTPR